MELDKGESVRVLFMDLSKTFDTIIHIYFKNRKQRTQINKNFSSEKNLIEGVPQGSINELFYLIFS